jgi:predicted RNA-binding Zn-ribbon protein involved in translation (DUF1610 family)
MEYDVIPDPNEPPLTDEQYVATKGMYCPNCGVKGDLRSTSDTQQDDTYIYQDVKCDACGAEYNDRYELVGYYHEETDEQKKPDLWKRDDIQFPRLIAEINSMVDSLDLEALAKSMDVTVNDVIDLFYRARVAWGKARKEHCG